MGSRDRMSLFLSSSYLEVDLAFVSVCTRFFRVCLALQTTPKLNTQAHIQITHTHTRTYTCPPRPHTHAHRQPHTLTHSIYISFTYTHKCSPIYTLTYALTYAHSCKFRNMITRINIHTKTGTRTRALTDNTPTYQKIT